MDFYSEASFRPFTHAKIDLWFIISLRYLPLCSFWYIAVSAIYFAQYCYLLSREWPGEIKTPQPSPIRMKSLYWLSLWRSQLFVPFCCARPWFCNPLSVKLDWIKWYSLNKYLYCICSTGDFFFLNDLSIYFNSLKRYTAFNALKRTTSVLEGLQYTIVWYNCTCSFTIKTNDTIFRVGICELFLV